MPKSRKSDGICQEFSAAKRACTLRITRDVTSDDLEGIIQLRNECFYPKSSDPRYASGGVHGLRDAVWVMRQHNADPTSHFVLVRDDAAPANLVAYARFSFVDADSPSYDPRIHERLPNVKSGRAVFNHVVIVGGDWRGQNVLVNGSESKISDAVFLERNAFARAQGCSIAFCDIAVSPVPNFASRRNMERCGMVKIGNAAPLIRDGRPVRFKRFAMGI